MATAAWAEKSSRSCCSLRVKLLVPRPLATARPPGFPHQSSGGPLAPARHRPPAIDASPARARQMHRRATSPCPTRAHRRGPVAPDVGCRSALAIGCFQPHSRLVHTTRTTGRPIRTLLFAADSSAATRAALLAVAGLAVGGRTEVVVMNVDTRNRPQEGLALATSITDSLIALAVNARPEVRSNHGGHVGREIAAAAVEYRADLVVLGSRGRSDLGGLLLGSVGHEVLQLAASPVLLVRAGRRAGGRPRRILLAVAGDEDLGELVGVTAAVAELEAHVLVLHLLAPGDGDLQFAVSAHLVEEIVTRLRKCGVHARGRVRAATRSPSEEIARTALGYGADLIVMGSRRLSQLSALLHRSVSHQVIHLSDRPMLVAAPNVPAGPKPNDP